MIILPTENSTSSLNGMKMATMLEKSLSYKLYDPDHSDDEERYLIIGESSRGRLRIM
jgi:hypothetical protein